MFVDMKFSITPQEIDLDLDEVQVISESEPGGEGTVEKDHSKLDNRDAKNSHPMSAITGLEDALAGKQPIVPGKGLSKNDFTDEDKEKLDSIEEGAQKNPDALPNPHKLIFTGAVQAEYDGTSEVEIEIPQGGTGEVSEIAPEKVIFTEDLTTTTAIGNIKLTNGQATIPAAGKNLVEVWNSIFVKEQNPAITQPSVSATFSEAKSYEAGTEVTPTWSASLNPGKYQFGPATGVTATAWEVSDTEGNTSDSASGSFPAVSVPDGGDYKITVKATYGAGTIPLTNTGNEYSGGQIKAGTKTATSPAITGFRNSFYGTMAEKATVDSAAIRGLTASGNALANGAAFDVVIPVGALRVVIAYPATLQDITSIKDVNGLNAEISSGFALATVDVEGASGYTAIPYKVYTMDFAKANDTENTFAVTI